MPGISLQRTAVHLTSDAQNPAGHGLLHHHHQNQYRQGEPFGHMMRGQNFPYTHPGDAARRPQQHQTGKNPGQGLNFTMSEGMFVVRGAQREMVPHPGQQRGEHICGRLNPVRNQGIGIAENPGENLHQHQPDVEQNRHHCQSDRTRGFHIKAAPPWAEDTDPK